MLSLEDKDGRLTLNDILGNGAAQSFRPVDNENPDFGFTASAYWFRRDFINRDSPIAEWFLESQFPTLDHIDAHLIDDNAEAAHFFEDHAALFRSEMRENFGALKNAIGVYDFKLALQVLQTTAFDSSAQP